jgi:hypothetical protein
MEKLKINATTNAERCEICHQLDQFDPVTNSCSRCQMLKAHQTPLMAATSLGQSPPIPIYSGMREIVGIHPGLIAYIYNVDENSNYHRTSYYRQQLLIIVPAAFLTTVLIIMWGSVLRLFWQLINTDLYMAGLLTLWLMVATGLVLFLMRAVLQFAPLPTLGSLLKLETLAWQSDPLAMQDRCRQFTTLLTHGDSHPVVCRVQYPNDLNTPHQGYRGYWLELFTTVPNTPLVANSRWPILTPPASILLPGSTQFTGQLCYDPTSNEFVLLFHNGLLMSQISAVTA